MSLIMDVENWALLPRVRGCAETVWGSGLITTRQGTRGNGMGVKVKHHASGDARKRHGGQGKAPRVRGRAEAAWGSRRYCHASGEPRKRYGDQGVTATRQGTRGSGTGIKTLLPRVRGRAEAEMLKNQTTATPAYTLSEMPAFPLLPVIASAGLTLT